MKTVASFLNPLWSPDGNTDNKEVHCGSCSLLQREVKKKLHSRTIWRRKKVLFCKHVLFHLFAVVCLVLFPPVYTPPSCVLCLTSWLSHSLTSFPYPLLNLTTDLDERNGKRWTFFFLFFFSKTGFSIFRDNQRLLLLLISWTFGGLFVASSRCLYWNQPVVICHVQKH